MRAVTIGVVVLAMLALADTAAAAPPQQVLYVGDSLGVGTTPILARELGSAARVHGDSRIGRPSGEGLRVLEQAFSPSDDIVVFDLGTNDDPAQPAVLARDLSAARRVTGDRCLIVATLNRPPLNGVSVDGLNQVVLAFASGAHDVQLVDWNAIAESEPGVLGPDRVHPSPQGYALRAQLFAEAVAACAAPPAGEGDSLATPAPTPKRPPRRRERRIKVPGIESSGISFTEPVRFRGLEAQLLLPNTAPPYPAVVMLGGIQAEAEFFAAHGIAALTYRDRGSVADARAAVALLARRDDIRRGGIGLWAFGGAAGSAAAAAAGNGQVGTVVALSPSPLPSAAVEAWRVDAPAVTAWLRTRSRGDVDPAAVWRRVSQPVLAIWGTRDDRLPIRASAEALRRALVAGRNRDRKFRWFNASHRGAVAYDDGQPVLAPGLLEETARWLGLRLGERRAKPSLRDALPPANPGPRVDDVTHASALYALPLQVAWLLAPALLLAVAIGRSHRALGTPAGSQRGPGEGATPVDALSRRRRLALGALVAGIGSAACTALGIALALAASDGVPQLAGTPWPFALAFVCAAALAASAIAAARAKAWLVAVAGALWVALALFWLV